jgi:hypothetical protein
MSYDSTIEDLVNNVRSFVDTNIANYVTEINTAKDDGITLNAIREIEISDQDPYGASKYPRIQLYVENLEVEYLASGYDAAHMQFVALVAIKDKSDQRTKLLRYAEAVRQELRDYNTLGESSFDVDPRGMTITYYPTDPDLGIGVATLRFRVYKEIPN